MAKKKQDTTKYANTASSTNATKQMVNPALTPYGTIATKNLKTVPTVEDQPKPPQNYYGGGNSAKPQTAAPAKNISDNVAPSVAAAPDYSAYAYDPSTNAAYTNAMAALENAKGELPQYAGTYDDQLDSLYQQIVGRDKFKYDLNEDMFYQQAADRAMQMGNMAMMDTMGQAAALTGGYGNTYAQNVGQQAYQGYIQQLNDNIPQFYQMALDAHNAEGDRLMQQYGLLGDLANREYSQYQDELANYWQNIGHLQGIADTEYGRGYENWYNAQQLGTSQQNANYDRLVSMMTTMGYQPSAQEIANAGLTGEQAQAFMDYYAAQNQPSGGYYAQPDAWTAPSAEDILTNTMAAVRDGTYKYTDAYQVIDAANKEGYITDEQRSAYLKDIYKAVRNK